eukprot:TRINITY_DN10277_c0_g1_i1.p1 TRINITY_DN10277_c0_g1~~TRINITY_DN10277_c0_g1_i1.p1  ORF type:complete len:439 (-),score=120.02 TRINITY_DN10277_c0_g1_i1:141-1457(-)
MSEPASKKPKPTYGAGAVLAEHTANSSFTDEQLRQHVQALLKSLGPKSKVLVIPPDYTRAHSQAGKLTKFIYEYYGDKLTDVLPALGSHDPVSRSELDTMFEGVPHELFRTHNWREDVVTVGEIEGEYVAEITDGKYSAPFPVQISKKVMNGGHDLILSVGQVVPHEVAGMANHTKNILVGTGGKECIDQSHFIGAVDGMEKALGRADSPVRKIFDKAYGEFFSHLPVQFILTVVAKDEDGVAGVRGLFAGDGQDCFRRACSLSQKLNIQTLPEEITKAVVYLDPDEFKTTWLGNKSVYRTRMAIADDGDLIVLAPGVKRFGEDLGIDKLIRKYGYKSCEEVVKLVAENEDIGTNLSAAAHLIHGSSEGRFNITYCVEHMTQEEIEGVGYKYLPLSEGSKRYDPSKLTDGWNTLEDGEKIFYVSNPALGLWAFEEKFK